MEKMMAISIDTVSIKGMKQSDFMQLEEIFNHVMQEDIRWDRLDYWDARNARIKKWLSELNWELMQPDVKIKDK